MASSLEIRCRACGHLCLARGEPVYEDFKKVSEAFVCTGCGHRYPTRAETPFVQADGRPRVFSEADRPAAVRVFRDSERRRCCGWCRHFVVNPFNQRCGLTNRVMEATDVCLRFAAKPDQAEEDGAAANDAAGRFNALFDKPAGGRPGK
jgi:hypothetical protein